MILVDTSAWVEFDRATGSRAHRRVQELIAADSTPADTSPAHSTPADTTIVTTEPVIMEVLAGAKDDGRERDLRRLLNRFGLLRFEAVTDFDGAVRTYRLCRGAGVTPRGLIDCMIASVAMRSGATVLSWDMDLSRIADVLPLRLDPASLRPPSP